MNVPARRPWLEPCFDVREIFRGFRPEWAPETGTELLTWTAEDEGREGAGVRIALLDGDALCADPELSGASVIREDFTGRGGDSAAAQEHATRDLKLLVGQGRARVRGIVPRAELLHARVLTEEGGEGRAVAAAIRWARARRAAIVALPLGMEDWSGQIAGEIDRGLAAGMCFIAAAGNGAPRPIDFPARHPGVLAVGGADQRGALLPSCCRSPRLDVIAPGYAAPEAGLLGRGSSVACVLAAGLLALRRGRCAR